MANKVIGSIPYSLALRPTKPGDADSPKKVFPALQQRETIDLHLLAKHIREHGSSFSVGTLYGVLCDMVECTIELLKGGYAVDFTGLAKFFLSVKAKPSDNVDDFTTEKIQKLNIRASVDASATAEVNANVDYEYVMTREEQAAAKKAAKATLPQAPKADGEDSGSTGDGNDSRSPKWAIFG